jgi:hypothetical protein
MARRKKPIPQFMDLSEVKPFIESNCEVEKDLLIHRIAGSVSYSILQIIKMIVFSRIGKDHNGNLYLV